MTSTTVQNRTFLWSIPRSVSTTFLKSISHLEDGVFWHEPYTQAIKFGSTKSSRRIAVKGKKVNPTKAPGKETSDGGFVYDSSKVTLAWVKHELERVHDGKTLVFVKELVGAIGDYLDWIPSGYHHTFLIRHPYKVCMSLLGVLEDTKSQKFRTDLKRQIPEQLQCFSKMCDLLEHIKETHDQKPVIVDADDLLLNPVGIMQAYCNDTGIPFTSELLHWDPGDTAMKNRWFVSKQAIGGIKSSKLYGSTFASTGFQKPTDIPLRTDLPDELLSIVDMQMPFYEKLYEQSIKCYIFTPLKD